MPYNIENHNGQLFLTLQDTDTVERGGITFIGRNYDGYGEYQNTNFLRLLENFAGNTPPSDPVIGQLWFDESTEQLGVYSAGKDFVKLLSYVVAPTPPTYPTDFSGWFDSDNRQLKFYYEGDWLTVGPEQNSTRARWLYSDENTSPFATTPLIVGLLDNRAAVVLSSETFEVLSSSQLDNFQLIKKGITLPGADPITGSTVESGNYFWGTAAESLVSKVSSGLSLQSNSEMGTFYVPFFSEPNGESAAYSNSGITFNPSTGILTTIASRARYADLAERYHADAPYEPGTVLVVGGTKEVTACVTYCSYSVAGVVSTNPAYMMNSDAGIDSTHPYVAIKGRVPCKVMGPITKGQIVVTSPVPGVGCGLPLIQFPQPAPPPSCVVGIALEHIEGNDIQLIEVKV